ncbi:sorbosone dehydrogenase, partial [Rhizobium ruizarguesonis]
LLIASADVSTVRIAHSIAYGLSAGVWRRDFATCLTLGRSVRAGPVWMHPFLDCSSSLPFVCSPHLGLGRSLGRHAFYA